VRGGWGVCFATGRPCAACWEAWGETEETGEELVGLVAMRGRGLLVRRMRVAAVCCAWCGVLSTRKCSVLVREAGVRACGVLDAWGFVFQLPG
jgi:hypothetical protein